MSHLLQQRRTHLLTPQGAMQLKNREKGTALLDV